MDVGVNEWSKVETRNEKGEEEKRHAHSRLVRLGRAEREREVLVHPVAPRVGERGDFFAGGFEAL